jgi:3-dehydroquinate synthase
MGSDALKDAIPTSIWVPTEDAGYPVDILDWRRVAEALPTDRITIADDQVASIAQANGIPVDITFPAGEPSKNVATYIGVLEQVANRRASRRTTLVAIGGGVTGDLVGFVAATYMRGVPFVQVPTTLLAMVDSSVGGKVGIDLPQGKNLAGSFYSPDRVLIPRDALETLPERQVRNGMAEVWKYGFIMSEGFVTELDAHPIQHADQVTDWMLQRCIEFKRDVVASDFRETTGARATLNFGHTIGHAIEKVLDYRELLHGEAISIGMVREARLGEIIGFCPAGTANEVESRMQRQGLPATHPVLAQADDLIAAMRTDKKSTGGKLAFSLISKLGACRLVPDVGVAEVRAVLAE